jgi:endonuclease IV
MAGRNQSSQREDTVMDNDKTYTVEIRDVYGKQTVYPVCDTAHTFAALTGCKTLTDLALMRINSLGYRMVIKQRELT